MAETVLVVGATGNIGVAAVIGALRSGRKVLAVVRNQVSADKLVGHVGSSEGITFAEADVTSDTGVRSVVDRVRAGELPTFQHVYACVGGMYAPTPLLEITTRILRTAMNVCFEANFFAYRETVPYLLEQKAPATWTLCTGAQGDRAERPLPAMTQGPLFSMATGAARETDATNVRFNEVYLAFRVEVDSLAAEHGVTKASDFAKVFEGILANPEIRSSRVSVLEPESIANLQYKKKF